jgi:stringent starvation protein B
MTAPNMIAAKRNVLQNLLKGGRDVTVVFDPRRPGTLVPLRFRRDPVLALNLGYEMAKPIPDLDVADDGIGATLSFGGREEWCFIPWYAVFCVHCDIGRVVWPNDMPPEAQAVSASGEAAPDEDASSSAGAEVIQLDSRRTPKERRACERRRRVAAKLTASQPHAGPGGAA